MALPEFYSKRQVKLEKSVPDVYSYEELPDKLRVQICHIISDVIGHDAYGNGKATEMYEQIYDILVRDMGTFELIKKNAWRNRDHKVEICNFLMQTESIYTVLDIIECTFMVINTCLKEQSYDSSRKFKLTPDAAITDLNTRFKEHAVGFHFSLNQIIRVDSEYAHTNIIKPTLVVLSDTAFEGANDEFLNAHSHYRSKRYKECLVDCLKAFESTMKTICQLNEWRLPKNAGAKDLIDVCVHNELLPVYSTNQFSAIRTLLESVATPRNKNAGHGQGLQKVDVKSYVAKHALNITATSIIYLVDAHNAREKTDTDF